MRTKEVLMGGLKDSLILYRYLYSDANNYIDVENAINVKFKIFMDENLVFWVKNYNFPDFPATRGDEFMSLSNIPSIVEQLKHQPAIVHPNYFTNRWDEIVHIVGTVVSMNN